MSFDYTRAKATADRLIGRFGQAATLERRVTSGPVNNPTVTTSSEPVTVVVDGYTNREVDGTRVLASDKKVMLAKGAVAAEPALSDKVLIGGVAHSIIRIDPLSPGGVVVYWTLQCRR